MENHIQNKKEISLKTTLVSNGSVDIRGRIADKQTTGGWKASLFIIEMKQSLPIAATHVTDWIGAAFCLTLLGAFLADAYLGRFKTIIIFSCIYVVGMIMLTISASIDRLHPSQCTTQPCTPASSGQTAFLYGALSLIALGTGGIKPCVSSFGADQFDEVDEKEVLKKYAFFNLFFFSINMGAILGATFMVYIQEKVGWTWGFAIPTMFMFCSIIILAAGCPYYRYQKPTGSAFTRFFQVIVVSLRNHIGGVQVEHQADLYEVETKESDILGAHKLLHTAQYRFLDKAAVKTDPEANTKSRWKLCTVTQVEEFKCFIRVLPIWATTISISVSLSLVPTFFVSQASIMNRNLGPNFIMPKGSVSVFLFLNTLILVPIYETLIIPILRKKTGNPRGITSLQRIGVGLFISIFAMGSAALIEKKRRDQYYSEPYPMSVLWLLPQIFILGCAEVCTFVGLLEFFYDEATDGTRSLNTGICVCELGVGNWLSTALVKIIVASTGGEEKGWLRNDLNESRLDNFYWILMGINLVNFFVYLWVAWRYEGKECSGRNGVVVGTEGSNG